MAFAENFDTKYAGFSCENTAQRPRNRCLLKHETELELRDMSIFFSGLILLGTASLNSELLW